MSDIHPGMDEEQAMCGVALATTPASPQQRWLPVFADASSSSLHENVQVKCMGDRGGGEAQTFLSVFKRLHGSERGDNMG